MQGMDAGHVRTAAFEPAGALRGCPVRAIELAHVLDHVPAELGQSQLIAQRWPAPEQRQALRAEHPLVAVGNDEIGADGAGSSAVDAVALVGALARLRALAGFEDLDLDQIVQRAHRIEEASAGVPCGMQDQLGAAYGGLNTWHWEIGQDGLAIRRSAVLTRPGPKDFDAHFLVAYCGIPHASRDINGTWVRRFLAGKDRLRWAQVADCVQRFSRAIAEGQWTAAAAAMNEETAIRRMMTPEVLDDIGAALVDAAVAGGCGGRFTGAGGGGCLWAVGARDAIKRLRQEWRSILAQRPEAQLLAVNADMEGLMIASQLRRSARG